jgi:hypothetical protein
MLLSKNQRFIEEHTNFSNQIAKIQDQKIKTECLQMLAELTAKVKEIDKHHTEFIGMSKLPSGLGDVREGIQTLRRKLTTKLKDCDQANLIK